MKILFATSEAHPLIKTGGLADVSGSLPDAYYHLKHKVRMVLPAYGDVWEKVSDVKQLSELSIGACGRKLHVRIHAASAEGIDIPIWLVDIPELFHRPGNPYLALDGKDWWDNGERFAVFSKVVAEIAMNRAGLKWQPDLVQSNDWQTGLVPALLTLESVRPKTVFTIHNMAYAGLFPKSLFEGLELPWKWWEPDRGIEFYNNMSMLKAGIQMADRVTTVSPSYAKEITFPEYAYGLEGVLIRRLDEGHLIGILNGIDQDLWNPKTDPFIDHHYSADKGRVVAKKRNKKEMLDFWDLPKSVIDSDDPVVGLVGRLVPQKGIDLVLDVLPELIEQTNARFIMVGTGDSLFEYHLTELAHQYPQRVMIYIGYSESLAHKVEAGADLFLMPSRFEPCGLNQLYSLAYGTPPIVHSTGGLSDTVVNATKENLVAGKATGFVFYDPSRHALKSTILHALHLFSKKRTWQKLQKNGMQQDFSWTRSAKQYLALFKAIV
ncbi:glycogen synthase GlgA [Hydrogenovibrio sp. 3SP14C1]|uniref:glycogen synthase GlgA n=1 Tax=Hydrogenovibrio sp. 3SP14C1 TaxID=3038774 RepID=UPI002417B713|nr:glycogen synthase GlgA [Hydrogenovibrio sp. 3SP14C1]MDG4811748.1 glycogen synthase GlgA [Hydrogenovibrio sp. 3SP14C1]